MYLHTGPMGVHRACFFITRAGRAATPERNRSGNQPPILCILPLVAHQLASARKNFVGGGLFDLGLGHLVEHFEQLAGALASFLGGPSQRRHARGSYRPGHDLQQPPRHAQADPLGLGDAGELVLFVACDLDGVLQSLLEILDLNLLPGELPLEFVDAGLDCGSVDSIGDLTGLAVKRLPRLLSVVRHLGDVAVSAAEDDKGAGDPLRDCGHGAPSIDANRG